LAKKLGKLLVIKEKRSERVWFIVNKIQLDDPMIDLFSNVGRCGIELFSIQTMGFRDDSRG
jgi:hypothetical protein